MPIARAPHWGSTLILGTSPGRVARDMSEARAREKVGLVLQPSKKQKRTHRRDSTILIEEDPPRPWAGDPPPHL